MRGISERDIDNLSAILDYCDRIHSITERFGNSYEQYRADADYQDAVMMNVFQIGEATNRLSDECKETLDMIPWHEIYGTRNVIAHGYVKVKDEIIWKIVERDIPILTKEITEKVGL